MKDLNINGVTINEDVIEALSEFQLRGLGQSCIETCRKAIDVIVRADDYLTANDRLVIVREILCMQDLIESFSLKEKGAKS